MASLFEVRKKQGDEAVQRRDYASAEGFYTEALSCEEAAPSTAPVVRAAVLCNRALARLRLERFQGAAEDASEVLAPGGGAAAPSPPEALRVKALFRRGLAREALGDLPGANADLNLALKAAPTNEGILEAAKRVKAALPDPGVESARMSEVWVPETTYLTPAVLQLADAVPGSSRGYLGASEHPTVRFPSGAGVQAHSRTGSLLAIRQALAPGRRAPQGVDVLTNDRDFKEALNFDLEDGLSVEYDIGGNLVMISQQVGGELHGPRVTFNKDGSVSHRETCCYRQGRVVSKLKSDVPEGFVAHVLLTLVVPVKRALGIGLAPGEELLCAARGVAPSAAPTADLAAPRPQRPGAAAEAAAGVQALAEEAAAGAPAPAPAPPAPALPAVGATWEELLGAPPSCEVGPGWQGPFAKDAAASESDEEGGAKAQEEAPAAQVRALAPQASQRRPDAPGELPEVLTALRGAWADEKEDTAVGTIQGGCVVWHRSFQTPPTKLRPAGNDGVAMELEKKTYTAVVEWHGPRTRLRWSDGEVWIRVSQAEGQGSALAAERQPATVTH